MNPRSLTRFLKSKFGLFVIFVAVLFTGLWIYSRHQAGVRGGKASIPNAERNASYVTTLEVLPD